MELLGDLLSLDLLLPLLSPALLFSLLELSCLLSSWSFVFQQKDFCDNFNLEQLLSLLGLDLLLEPLLGLDLLLSLQSLGLLLRFLSGNISPIPFNRSASPFSGPALHPGWSAL